MKRRDADGEQGTVKAQSMRRQPYAVADMVRLVAPRSVAVIGVSERAAGFGSRVVANMAAFDGAVYQINAKYPSLAGRPCYSSLDALPETPDCVVIATQRDAVEPLLLQCADRGVGAVVVFAAGYAETAKPENIAAQARLVALARAANMRLVGPNTIGLVNYASGAGMTFSAMPERRPLQRHAIGIVSQSGSLGFSLSQAVMRGVSVSHVLTAGNSCDVDVADHVAYLAQDPACRAIACLFEGMADPTRMIAAAELAWQADKPLVLYKMATGSEGARAALSHTGSLAGSDAAYRAAFARCGVIQVDRLEALVEAAAFFAKAPAPGARGGGGDRDLGRGDDHGGRQGGVARRGLAAAGCGRRWRVGPLGSGIRLQPQSVRRHRAGDRRCRCAERLHGCAARRPGLWRDGDLARICV